MSTLSHDDTTLRAGSLPLFVFAGSFLMFALEPMVGRMLLPSFGGGFHVWATCLMFFQGALLLGYAYAHLLAPKLGRYHLLIACLPLVLLPIGVETDVSTDSDITTILLTLVSTVAIPFGVLATTGVIAQSWLAASSRAGSKNPYFLYAASNAGSLSGLLAYPFVVEPMLGVSAQQAVWSVLYLGYLALAFLVAPQRARSWTRTLDGDAEAPRASAMVYWWLLSMAPSIMLKAVTNTLSSDVGSIPLVWVAPLALYLITFILIFRHSPWYPKVIRRYWPEIAASGLVVLSAWVLFPNWPRLLWHLLVLFVICMCGHAELYRSRPAPRHLTAYYLVISAGGFAGGVFVSLIVPHIFTQLHEYGVALLLLATTLAVGRREELLAWLKDGSRRIEQLVRAPLNVAALGLSITLLLPGAMSTEVLRLRNHYGIYQIGDLTQPLDLGLGAPVETPIRYLNHNGTTHGMQILSEEGRRTPTAYYHRESPLGDVLALDEGNRRVGIIGLGAGVIAPYFGAGDEVVYYEIDADSERIARELFSYLDDCEASLRVVIGDARLELASDPGVPDGSLDYLIVDAFSGDAIPTHILTKEALELYKRKIRPDGLLIFNISNRFYDLREVLSATAHAVGLVSAYKFRSGEKLGVLELKSRWAVASADPGVIERLRDKGWTPSPPPSPGASPWTDDYVNILAPLWAEIVARN